MAKKEAKSKGKAKTGREQMPAPVSYLIHVHVDAHGKFTYTADGIPDASSLKPRNGDTISWSLRHMGVPVPFQVEFPGFGPFGVGTRVVRSTFLPTDPLTVTVPKYYHGNLVFKYTVTMFNGWSDDPDVEPVPAVLIDKDTQNIILLSVSAGGDLVLNSSEQPFDKGEVEWKWDGQPLDDFVLTFDEQVAGWPLQASSQSQRIVLDLESPGTAQDYTIQTVHLGLSADGTLSID